MRSKTLWKRLAAVALAVVLAVPAFSAVPVKEAEAKEVTKAVVQADFNDGTYPEEIMNRNDATLTVVDGALKVETSQGNGVRAAWVQVKEGKTYRISYDIKVESVSSIVAIAQSWYEENEEDNGQNWSDADYFNNDVVYQGTQFVRKTYEYTVPADAQRNYMQFMIVENHGQSESVFYIDNFVIEEVNEVPNLVTNGSFGSDVADTAGWGVGVSVEETKVETTENVLYSRNFDDDYSLGFNGWNINNTTTEITSVDGDNAVAFKKGANKYITYYGTPFEADVTYEVSCKVKASADTYFRVLYDISGSPHDIKMVGTEWKDYTFTFTTSAANSQPILYFGIMDDSDNTVYIDDVCIKSTATKAITEEVKTDVYTRDFDSDAALGFANWNITNSTTSLVEVDGDNAVSFQKGANKYITYYGTPFVADTTYEVSCKVKASADTYFRVLYDISGSPHDIKTVGTEWMDYSFTFTASAANNQPVLYFGIMDDTDNTIYIDDVSIRTVEEKSVKEYTDGVGAFGKVGYGLKVTDNTVATTVADASTRYEFSLWLKVEEGAQATVLANGTTLVAASEGTNGEWINHVGEFGVEDGLDTFGIQAEGTVYVDEIEVYAHVHDIYSVEGKAATCEETGVAAHYVCLLCDEHFADAEGKDVITEEDYVIPTGGHTEEIVPGKEATCTETGLTEGKKCSVCEDPIVEQETIPAKGHKYDKGKVTKAATCEATGVMTYTCTVCEATKTSVIAKVAMPGKSAITKATGAKKKITIKFKKVSNIGGYEIQIATKKNMKKGLKTYKVGASKAKYVAKKLKAKTKYWVRIRTYKVAGGKTSYSDWSAKKTVKTK